MIFLFLRDIKTIFKQPVTAVCIVIYACLLILGAAEDLQNSSSLFELFWFSENFGVTLIVRSLVFPIAVVSGYCAERHGHYDWLMMMRMGEKKYCAFRVISCWLIGIFLYLLSAFLFCCIVMITADGDRVNTAERLVYFFGQKTVWSSLAEKTCFLLSFFLYILLNSLAVGICILLALCAAVFDWNKYAIFTIPFLLGRIGSFFDGSPLSLLFYSPFGRELETDGGMVSCLLRNGIAGLILGFLFYKEVCWRKRHG